MLSITTPISRMASIPVIDNVVFISYDLIKERGWIGLNVNNPYMHTAIAISVRWLCVSCVRACARDERWLCEADDCTMKRDIYSSLNFFFQRDIYEILFIDIMGVPPSLKFGGGWLGRTHPPLSFGPYFFSRKIFCSFTG